MLGEIYAVVRSTEMRDAKKKNMALQRILEIYLPFPDLRNEL